MSSLEQCEQQFPSQDSVAWDFNCWDSGGPGSKERLLCRYFVCFVISTLLSHNGVRVVDSGVSWAWRNTFCMGMMDTHSFVLQCFHVGVRLKKVHVIHFKLEFMILYEILLPRFFPSRVEAPPFLSSLDRPLLRSRLMSHVSCLILFFAYMYVTCLLMGMASNWPEKWWPNLRFEVVFECGRFIKGVEGSC